MKRIVSVLIAVILVLTSTGMAYADGPTKKLGRGMSNVATCLLELPAGVGRANEESGLVAGFTWGLLLGTFNVVKRAVVGVYEVVTFPIPIPGDYEPVLSDPEFFFEDGTGGLGN